MPTFAETFLSAEQQRRIRDNIPTLSNRPDGHVDLSQLLNDLVALLYTDIGTIEDGIGDVRVATGTLSTAQVAALNATPIEVIAAPGAGYFIEVIDCDWFLDFASSAYDAAAAGDTLGLKYTNGSGVQLVDTVAGNAIGAASADYHALVKGAVEVNHTAGDNAPVVAHIDTGEWGSGDSPLKYAIRYRVRQTLA